MFRRIGKLLVKDLLYSMRESILVYSLAGILLMALGALFFLPSLEQLDLRIAVDGSLPRQVAEQLEAYGRVERYESRERLRQRVLAFDDVPGIYYDSGEYVVLLEGNEESYIQALPGVILERILQGEDFVELSTVSLGRERSPVREYTAMFFLLNIFLIGGFFIGLSIVDDRQSGIIRALAVTPVNILEYMFGKSLLGLLVVVAATLAVATILLGAAAINYPLLLIWIVSSLGIAIFIGFLIGIISNNMITAIAVIKVIALPSSGIPLAALFLPERLKWLLYPFPNYWSFEGFFRMFIRPELPLAAVNLVTFVFSFILVILLVTRFGHKMRLSVKE